MGHEDRETAAARENTRGLLPLAIGFNVLALVSLVLAIVWGSKYLGGFDWSVPGQRFNWHPVLMVTGLVLVYGNGALVYRLLRSKPKPQLKLAHAAVNGVAFLLAIVGSIAVFSFHNQKNIPNLYSLHSWLGLGTMTLFGGNLVGGFAVFLLPHANDRLRALVLPLHVFGGSALLSLIAVSIVSGITEKAIFKLNPSGYGQLPAEAYVLNFVGTFATLAILVLAFILSRGEYKRRPLSTEIPIRIAMQESTH